MFNSKFHNHTEENTNKDALDVLQNERTDFYYRFQTMSLQITVPT